MFNVIAIIIKLVERLSVSQAARLTYYLATWPRRLPLKERDRENLAGAIRIDIKADKNLTAWSWGSGPLVLLMHGWEGNSAQMALLAMHLADKGFQAVAVDVRAHGSSQGRRTNFFDFPDDLSSVIEYLGRPVYACIGHSAGGLLLMAGRAKNILRAEHYITISAPRGPYPPLDIVRRLLKVSEDIIAQCKKAIAVDFSCEWRDLIQGCMYEYQGQGRLMMIYDKSDQSIDQTDADKILKYWPDAHLIKTKNYGHYRLLWAPEVMEQISGFLLSNKNEPRTHAPAAEEIYSGKTDLS